MADKDKELEKDLKDALKAGKDAKIAEQAGKNALTKAALEQKTGGSKN